MQPLVPLAFPSLYPPSFSFTDFWLCRMQNNIGAKKRSVIYMQLLFPSSLQAITVGTSLHLFSYLFVVQHAGIELGPPLRY